MVDEGKVRVEVTLEGVEPGPQPLTVLLAMPRPQMLRRILQKAATFGVERLVLFRSARVEKSYFSSPLLLPDSIRAQLLLGLEQGGGTRLPEVAVFAGMREFLASGELDSSGMKLLLDISGEKTLLDYPLAQNRRIFVIGPEGGLLPNEMTLFEERGFERIRVSKSILRVESAFDFALAQSELFVLREPGDSGRRG
jgi:RsmE family RNA methyltransferase